MKLFEKIDALSEVENILVEKVGPYVLTPAGGADPDTTGNKLNDVLRFISSEKTTIHAVVNQGANYVAKTVTGIDGADPKYNYQSVFLSRDEAIKAMLAYEKLSFQWSFQNPADLSVQNINAKTFSIRRLNVIDAFELLIESIQAEVDRLD